MEINELREKLLQPQDNQFIETPDDKGLRKYEQVLNIAYVEDEAVRRFNILNKYNSTIPFTMMWLNNM